MTFNIVIGQEPKQLFVVKDAGVGGRVYMIVGPTTFNDALDTLTRNNHRLSYPRILCADTMSGPSALATQRSEE
jgi:hypothetical protein